MSHEYLNNQQNSIAVIELRGKPYQRFENGVSIDCTKTLETLAVNSGYEQRLQRSIERHQEDLVPLFKGGYYGLDARIKKGKNLSYSEAFSLMTFVSMGANRLVHSKISPHIRVGSMDPDTVLLQSIALLSAMSAKEGFVGLTADEIAGLAAATSKIDTVVRIPAKGEVLGVGGMGGDRGYKRNSENSKLFSLSTMGAVVMSNFGYVHKHHSYPNTSKVAGQSAIEAFGARSDQSDPASFERLQENVGLLMTSCHTTRFIHSLSHRLKGETINHVVGPISIPVDSDTPLSAFIGVNDNVHPETMIQALSILQQRNVQRLSNSVAFCGLNSHYPMGEHFDPDAYYRNRNAKESVAIDEVAPPPHKTLAAFLMDGENIGTYIIEPDDFMDPETFDQIDYMDLLIPNTHEAIVSANMAAITGQDTSKALYLSMTAALGLFTREYSGLPDAFDQKTRRVNHNYLRDAFNKAYDSIMSGAAYSKLQQYVDATNQVSG